MKTTKQELAERDKIIKNLRTDVQRLTEFARALGFYPRNNAPGFVTPRARPCTCGQFPVIAPYMYGEGTWVAQCRKCATRTIESRHPIEALKNWNADKLTEESQMTRYRLTRDDIDYQGAMNLIGAIKECAMRDLMDAERYGDFDNQTAISAEWFLKDPKKIEGIKSGLYRQLLEERKKEEERKKAQKEAQPDDLY